MSKISLSPSPTGSAVYTIASPAGSTDRTFNLPDSAGTVATAESTLAQFNVTGSAPVFACRAWVNFDGTGTVAIRASGNVSSITDLGVGQYRLNFSTAMPDTNYATVFYNNAFDSTIFSSFDNDYTGGLGGVTTTSVEVSSYSGTFSDSRFFNVVIFR